MTTSHQDFTTRLEVAAAKLGAYARRAETIDHQWFSRLCLRKRAEAFAALSPRKRVTRAEWQHGRWY